MMKDNLCAICLTDQLDKPVELMPCNHKYCKTCIQKWFETKEVCPYCNQNISHIKLKIKGIFSTRGFLTKKQSIKEFMKDHIKKQIFTVAKHSNEKIDNRVLALQQKTSALLAQISFFNMKLFQPPKEAGYFIEDAEYDLLKIFQTLIEKNVSYLSKIEEDLDYYGYFLAGINKNEFQSIIEECEYQRQFQEEKEELNIYHFELSEIDTTKNYQANIQRNRRKNSKVEKHSK